MLAWDIDYVFFLKIKLIKNMQSDKVPMSNLKLKTTYFKVFRFASCSKKNHLHGLSACVIFLDNFCYIISHHQ